MKIKIGRKLLFMEYLAGKPRHSVFVKTSASSQVSLGKFTIFMIGESSGIFYQPSRDKYRFARKIKSTKNNPELCKFQQISCDEFLSEIGEGGVDLLYFLDILSDAQ